MSGMTFVVTALQMFEIVLTGLIFINVILSWLPLNRENMFVKIVNGAVDPMLNPIRKAIIKSPFGGVGRVIDFSPIIALMLIRFSIAIIISLIS